MSSSAGKPEHDHPAGALHPLHHVIDVVEQLGRRRELELGADHPEHPEHPDHPDPPPVPEPKPKPDKGRHYG